MRKFLSVLVLFLLVGFSVPTPSTAQEVSAADSLEQTLVDGVQKFERYATKFEEVVKKKAPEAYDVSLHVVRINAAQEILLGTLSLSIGIFLLWLGRRCQRWDKEYPSTDYGAGVFFSWVGSCIFSAASLFGLANVWAWVGLFNPDLVVARRILNQLFGGF